MCVRACAKYLSLSSLVSPLRLWFLPSVSITAHTHADLLYHMVTFVRSSDHQPSSVCESRIVFSLVASFSAFTIHFTIHEHPHLFYFTHRHIFFRVVIVIVLCDLTLMGG